MSDNILEVQNLEVVYNGFARAVQGVSISVPPDKIVGIVGINGAGKTTTMSAIAGFMAREKVEITNGSVRFLGSEIRGLQPDVIAKRGLALVPEREKIFARMTTWENLVASSIGSKGIAIDVVLDFFPRLAERRKVVAGYLSGGERQMLAIGMAILSNPRLLLIDEFSLGLSPAMVGVLSEKVLELQQKFGIAVLFVEQNATYAASLADILYVLENGRVALSGPTADIVSAPSFRSSYLALGADDQHRSFRSGGEITKRVRWFG